MLRRISVTIKASVTDQTSPSPTSPFVFHGRNDISDQNNNFGGKLSLKIIKPSIIYRVSMEMTPQYILKGCFPDMAN